MSNIKPVVMVTGAARGFGKELLQQFRVNGFQIFATARTIPEVVVQGEIWHVLDVSSYEQCANAINVGFERFGHIDVLISNAAAYTGGTTIADVSKADIDAEVDITLRGSIYLTKLYVGRARIQKSGKIIFISSIAGLDNEADCALHSVYSAAKAALIRFAECLNEDINAFGMQAHVLVPCSMKDANDESNLQVKDIISYEKAARSVIDIATCADNLASTKTILRSKYLK